MHPSIRLTTLAVFLPAVLHAQSRTVSNAVRPFVSVEADRVALTHVRLVDGTGAAPLADQTIIIDGERIVAVGNAADVQIPAGAEEIDLTGHTVIPGIIGLHDHMYYSSVGGSMKFMPFSYPRLFLANGVTTIRTTGSVPIQTATNPGSESSDGARCSTSTVLGSTRTSLFTTRAIVAR